MIKQARPHVDAGLDGSDARTALRREAAALSALAGLAPALVEVFEQSGHTFLVERLVPGQTLAEWAQQRLAGANGGLSVDTVAAMAVRLSGLLGEVHKRGLVYRDFTPNNVMVTPQDDVLLIDPELAVRPGAPASPGHTPGFAAPECTSVTPYRSAPGPAADCFSLGATLFYLVIGASGTFAEDTPTDRSISDRLGLVLRLAGRHSAAARWLGPAIRGLCASDPARRWTLDRLDRFLADPPGDPIGGARSPNHGSGSMPEPVPVDRLLDDGLAHILATMGDDGTDRLWPSGSFGATTESSNVQHGAAGVLALLTLAGDVLDRIDLVPAIARVTRWIQRRRRNIPRILPGLYFGQSGTAWALWEAARLLADDNLAAEAVDLALAVPVRWANPDVFHGAAGAGLLQLYMWQATGRTEFLDRAGDCADGLLAAAQYADDRVFWPIPADFDSSMAGISHFGYAHGVAGVGAFLLDAGLATGRQDCLDAASAAGATLERAVERGPWGARWRNDRSEPPGTGLLYSLCSGSSGVGTFLLRLWRATGDATALELARDAATAVYRTRWSTGSAVCHGLAGNGHFLLDLAEALDPTGSADKGEVDGAGSYRAQAEQLAACLYAWHARRNGRLVLPDESSTEVTVDYQVGSAGALGFLLRLRHGTPRPFMPAAAGRLLTGR